ncbi:MAG: hypothetical protein MHM6MM_006475 [Cercozoa sp. M6MM]
MSLAIESFSELTVARFKGLALILYLTFMIIVAVLMLNLLIAFMSESTAQIHVNAEKRWLLEWATTIVDLERRAPSFMKAPAGVCGRDFGFHDAPGELFLSTLETTDSFADGIDTNEKRRERRERRRRRKLKQQERRSLLAKGSSDGDDADSANRSSGSDRDEDDSDSTNRSSGFDRDEADSDVEYNVHIISDTDDVTSVGRAATLYPPN